MSRYLSIQGPQRGFGLTEALIALIVGMVTVVVIMQALSNAENQRRAISGGSDAGTNGTIALQLLQRDLLSAGYGMAIQTPNAVWEPDAIKIASDLYSTCHNNTLRVYNARRIQGNGAQLAQQFNLPPGALAPVARFDARTGGISPTPAFLIADDPDIVDTAGVKSPTGFDEDTDVLLVTYSGASTFPGAGVVLSNQNAATSYFEIVTDTASLTNQAGRNGIHQGDLVIVGNSPPDGTDCVMAQVTELPGIGGNNALEECAAAVSDPVVPNVSPDSKIVHKAGVFRNWHATPTAPTCGNDTAVWNQPGLLNQGVALGNQMQVENFPPPVPRIRPRDRVSPAPRLFSVGAPDRFVMRAYGIRGGRLMVCSPLLQNCTETDSWTTVADNIVSMRVMFGIDLENHTRNPVMPQVAVPPVLPPNNNIQANCPRDTANTNNCPDGVLQPITYAGNGAIATRGEWYRNIYQPAAPANPWTWPAQRPRWADYRAVHVAVVSRSGTLKKIVSEVGGQAGLNETGDAVFNRDDLSQTCQPDWAGFTHDRTVAPNTRQCGGAPGDGEFWLRTGHDGVNWRRYPYRVFETTVSLRSMYWSDNSVAP